MNTLDIICGFDLISEAGCEKLFDSNRWDRGYYTFKLKNSIMRFCCIQEKSNKRNLAVYAYYEYFETDFLLLNKPV